MHVEHTGKHCRTREGTPNYTDNSQTKAHRSTELQHNADPAKHGHG